MSEFDALTSKKTPSHAKSDLVLVHEFGRSAVKARKSFATQASFDSVAQSTKTIQSVKRHRKQRHIKLKELAKDDEEINIRDSWLARFTGEEITCPVCSTIVRGDQDVVGCSCGCLSCA